MRCDVSSPGESARCGDGDRPCHRQRHHLRLDSSCVFWDLFLVIIFIFISPCLLLA